MPNARTSMFVARLNGKTSVVPAHGIEAASSAWKKGALLVNSSGKLAEAGADPTVSLGVALTAATGVTDKPVMYVPMSQDVEFEISADRSGALGTGQVTEGNLNGEFGVARDTNGIWYLDLDETTTRVFRITEIPKGMTGVNMPRVIVKPLLAIIE